MKNLSPGQYPRGQEDQLFYEKDVGFCAMRTPSFIPSSEDTPLCRNGGPCPGTRPQPLRLIVCHLRPAVYLFFQLSLSPAIVRAKEKTEAWSSPSPVLLTSVLQGERKVPRHTLGL